MLFIIACQESNFDVVVSNTKTNEIIKEVPAIPVEVWKCIPCYVKILIQLIFTQENEEPTPEQDQDVVCARLKTQFPLSVVCIELIEFVISAVIQAFVE